jgi:hypothetical protein
MRIVQIQHPKIGRAIARVEGNLLRLLSDMPSIYHLAQDAINQRRQLASLVEQRQSRDTIDYDAVYNSQSEWRLLPSFDHPAPSRCLVSGTGLTHQASAQNRQSMHDAADLPITDSMKMYQIGLEGGRPSAGAIGSQPEWFYKGTGDILRAHGESLDVPCYAHDGGDEAEIAGAYVIAPDGTPWRVGLTQGNEFSDHQLEAKNYLYLAQSKLRRCAIGPELIVAADFREVSGATSIERAGKTIWQAALASGQVAMCHSLANLEHHHFKIDFHRRSGDAHIHFLGADVFSFRDRLVLEEGDVMTVAFEGFGRALRNPIHIDCTEQKLIEVKAL